jgi:hypothetical protein
LHSQKKFKSTQKRAAFAKTRRKGEKFYLKKEKREKIKSEERSGRAIKN